MGERSIIFFITKGGIFKNKKNELGGGGGWLFKIFDGHM